MVVIHGLNYNQELSATIAQRTTYFDPSAKRVFQSNVDGSVAGAPSTEDCKPGTAKSGLGSGTRYRINKEAGY